ncbi:hypothetical protein TrRE_jg847, partial [Triparma retinervis]
MWALYWGNDSESDQSFHDVLLATADSGIRILLGKAATLRDIDNERSRIAAAMQIVKSMRSIVLGMAKAGSAIGLDCSPGSNLGRQMPELETVHDGYLATPDAEIQAINLKDTDLMKTGMVQRRGIAAVKEGDKGCPREPCQRINYAGKEVCYACKKSLKGVDPYSKAEAAILNDRLMVTGKKKYGPEFQLLDRAVIQTLKLDDDDSRRSGLHTDPALFSQNIIIIKESVDMSPNGNFDTILSNLDVSGNNRRNFGQPRYSGEKQRPRRFSPSPQSRPYNRTSKKEPQVKKVKKEEPWQINTLKETHVEVQVTRERVSVGDDGTVSLAHVIETVNMTELEGDILDYVDKAEWKEVEINVTKANQEGIKKDFLSDSGCIGAHITPSSDGAISERTIASASLNTADHRQDPIKITKAIVLAIRVSGTIDNVPSRDIVMIINALVAPGIGKSSPSKGGFLSELDLCKLTTANIHTIISRSTGGENKYVFKTEENLIEVPLDGAGQGDHLRGEIGFLNSNYVADMVLDLRSRHQSEHETTIPCRVRPPSSKSQVNSLHWTQEQETIQQDIELTVDSACSKSSVVQSVRGLTNVRKLETPQFITPEGQNNQSMTVTHLGVLPLVVSAFDRQRQMFVPVALTISVGVCPSLRGSGYLSTKALELDALRANVDIQFIAGSHVENHILLDRRYELKLEESSGMDVLHGHVEGTHNYMSKSYVCDLADTHVETRPLMRPLGKAFSSNDMGDGPLYSQLNSLRGARSVPRPSTKPQEDSESHLSAKEKESDGEHDKISLQSSTDEDVDPFTGCWDRRETKRQHVKADAHFQVSPHLKHFATDECPPEFQNFMVSSTSILKKLGEAAVQRATGACLEQLQLARLKTILQRPTAFDANGFDVASESLIEMQLRDGRTADRFKNGQHPIESMLGTFALAALVADNRQRHRGNDAEEHRLKRAHAHLHMQSKGKVASRSQYSAKLGEEIVLNPSDRNKADEMALMDFSLIEGYDRTIKLINSAQNNEPIQRRQDIMSDVLRNTGPPKMAVICAGAAEIAVEAIERGIPCVSIDKLYNDDLATAEGRDKLQTQLNNSSLSLVVFSPPCGSWGRFSRMMKTLPGDGIDKERSQQLSWLVPVFDIIANWADRDGSHVVLIENPVGSDLFKEPAFLDFLRRLTKSNKSTSDCTQDIRMMAIHSETVAGCNFGAPFQKKMTWVSNKRISTIFPAYLGRCTHTKHAGGQLDNRYFNGV